ncbi:hypothetical protein BRIN106911_18005 [Brevibacillus invocatus]
MRNNGHVDPTVVMAGNRRKRSSFLGCPPWGFTARLREKNETASKAAVCWTNPKAGESKKKKLAKVLSTLGVTGSLVYVILYGVILLGIVQETFPGMNGCQYCMGGTAGGLYNVSHCRY